ncbi:glycerol-3-phosphate dehydrogenase (NAD(P)+) [Roseomonas rosea]|uniref:Glycerol-3-phosphate dehydrogenase n=1 Tax=Muricoccus roseus TaxID=198092 RepID=A0A1M6AHP9_9PROT|nr:NAD(P)H-dependent glycerol-3-phosphate dehydrogenase [Roseomonas rosea]SHI36009.1 glycerol-3-phosphate dehydrogenase (NAD(P)+) [Roseomonas rosea]
MAFEQPSAAVLTEGHATPRKASVTVIGAGAFGTAVGVSLARGGHAVTLCCRTEEQASAINAEGENRNYFPGHALPNTVSATSRLEPALSADVVCLAFPAKQMDDYVARFERDLPPDAIVINLVKGLHDQTFTFAGLFAQRLPGVRYVALKGPTFARPLFNAEWSGLTCGTSSESARQVVQDLFRGLPVDLDHCASAEAVDAVSAIKNVYAVVLGLVASMGLTENTTFLLISRIVKEISIILRRLGYDSSALLCHCGLGDTLLTGLCDTSRNRTLGFMMGKGIPIDPNRSGFLAEGSRAVTTLHRRAGGPDTPLLEAVQEILAGHAQPISILAILGGRA